MVAPSSQSSCNWQGMLSSTDPRNQGDFIPEINIELGRKVLRRNIIPFLWNRCPGTQDHKPRCPFGNGNLSKSCLWIITLMMKCFDQMNLQLNMFTMFCHSPLFRKSHPTPSKSQGSSDEFLVVYPVHPCTVYPASPAYCKALSKYLYSPLLMSWIHTRMHTASCVLA